MLGSVGEALFFGIFLCMGLVAFVVMMVLLVVPEWRANRQFSATQCTVLATSIAESETDDSKVYRPDVKIEYTVAGRKYVTTTYDAVRVYSSGRHHAERAIEKFQVGKQYVCWYDPFNPDQAVLVRGYNAWMYLLLLVPASFIAIGGGGLIYTAWHWGASAERRASLSKQAAKLDVLREKTGGTPLPNVPSPVDAHSSEGTRLAYRLPIATTPGWQLFVIFIMCLFWNGITSVFVVLAVQSHLRGRPEWFLTLFIIPFVLVGLGLIYFLLRELLITTGIGPTRLECSHYPLEPGQECELLLIQAGRLSMNSLIVELACDEQVSYRQGTDTRTETKRVFSQNLFRHEGFAIDPAAPFEHQWSLVIPELAMHSFKSPNHEVKWKLVVEGDVANWPNFRREYPLIVVPTGTLADAPAAEAAR
jgi:hypothetical protein